MNNELTPREKKVIGIINRKGVTAPILLQAMTGLKKVPLQHVLSKLWVTGHIYRPVTGIVVSRKWAERNADKVYEYSVNLGTDLTT